MKSTKNGKFREKKRFNFHGVFSRKGAIATLIMATLSSGLNAQVKCTTDPDDYTDYTMAGHFNDGSGGTSNRPDDVIMVYSNYNLSADILLNVRNSSSVLKTIPITPTLPGSYLDDVSGRKVVGDFDNDYKDDFLLLKRISATLMRFDFFEPNASATAINQSVFYTQTGYDADKITGRVVSGDFDRDGFKDDVAVFYDYGGGVTKIHVFKSNGSTLVYEGSYGWWNSSGYTANKITDRVVSGDFDKDGWKDDIAAFYDYGGGVTKIHVWLSSGSSFVYQGAAGWFNSSGYYADKITGRVVSVNIDRDGYFYDDIAVFYDYGGTVTRMHTFESTGSSFTYSGATGVWYGSVYNANEITGKVVALEAESDPGIYTNGISDLLAFYDYGPSTNKFHLWKGNHDLWGNTTIDYNHYLFCYAKSKTQASDMVSLTENRSLEIEQYPNPARNEFFYNVGNQDVTEVWVTDLQGKVLIKERINPVRGQVNCSDLIPGTYICIYLNESEIVDRQKLSIVQ
jgi:hypothetical protein